MFTLFKMFLMIVNGFICNSSSVKYLSQEVNVFFFLFSDLLAVPKHPYAAMENWGLSVFVEQRILLDPSISSISYLLDVTMVIVHELCHQVFEVFKYIVLMSGTMCSFSKLKVNLHKQLQLLL